MRNGWVIGLDSQVTSIMGVFLVHAYVFPTSLESFKGMSVSKYGHYFPRQKNSRSAYFGVCKPEEERKSCGAKN